MKCLHAELSVYTGNGTLPPTFSVAAVVEDRHMTWRGWRAHRISAVMPDGSLNWLAAGSFRALPCQDQISRAVADWLAAQPVPQGLCCYALARYQVSPVGQDVAYCGKWLLDAGDLDVHVTRYNAQPLNRRWCTAAIDRRPDPRQSRRR